MPREDVVHVLRRFREALGPGGVMLDLQVIPPQPAIEVGGRAVGSIEGGTLIEDALAAAAVIDAEIARGLLREEAVDDHDVLRHFESGPALLEHFEGLVPLLAATPEPCAIRELCRLRRLVVA